MPLTPHNERTRSAILDGEQIDFDHPVKHGDIVKVDDRWWHVHRLNRPLLGCRFILKRHPYRGPNRPQED